MRAIVGFWLEVLADVIRDFIRDDCSFLASGIAFWGFFSLFPICLLSVTFLSWALSVPWIHDQVVLGVSQLGEVTHDVTTPDGFDYTMRLVQSFMPTQVSWLEEELKVLSRHVGRNVFISIILGLWSGRHMFMAMEYSLHRAWSMPMQRNWFSSSFLSMYLIVVTALVSLVMLVGASVLQVAQGVLLRFPMPSFMGFSLNQALFWSWLVSWVVIPAGVSALFLMWFRVLPSRPLPVLYTMPGAIFAGLSWKLSSWIYLEYGIRFGSISAFYGSIWYVVGLMGWLYVMALVFLVAAEVVYAYAHNRESVIGGAVLPTKL